MSGPVRADALDPTEGDLAALGARYGLTSLERVGGFENLIYRSDERDGVVLRLTHTSRRSVADVEADPRAVGRAALHRGPRRAPVTVGRRLWWSAPTLDELRDDDGSETGRQVR